MIPTNFEPRTVDNEYIFGINYTNPAVRTTRTLTATRRTIHGRNWTESVLRAAASVTGPFITTDHIGDYNPATHDGRLHLVKDIHIDGQRFANSATSPSQAAIADGIDLDGENPNIHKVKVSKFWGNGIVGNTQQYITACEVNNCFTGIKIRSSDHHISGNLVYDHRDYCLWMTGGGNNQSIGNHYYGSPKYAVFLQGTIIGFRGTLDTYADCRVGFRSEGGANTHLTDCLFQHCTECCAYFSISGFNHIVNSPVIVQRVTDWSLNGKTYGIIWDGANNHSVRGGSVILDTYYHTTGSTPTGAPAHGILVKTAHKCIIDTPIYDAAQINGSHAIELEGNIKGLEVRTNITSSFYNSSSRPDSRFIYTVSGVPKALDIVIKNDDIDLADPGKWINLPVGWTGKIILWNTASGDTLQLSEGIAYTP